MNAKATCRAKRTLFAALLLLVVFTAAATAAAKDKKNNKQQQAAATVSPPDPSKLVWPPPPDVARVKWVSYLQSEDDLNPVAAAKKQKRSWMDRMAGVQLPSDRGKPRLRKPYGVAVDSAGLVYVSDLGQAALFVINLEQKTVALRGADVFSAPAGVAVDDTDRVFVADSNLHAIFCFRPDGSMEGTFGERQLGRPVGIAVDNENRFVYAVDAQNHRLAIFDADNFKFLRYLGKQSEPPNRDPGTFETPTNVAIDSDGNVYVVDTLNNRVQVFNADGEFVRAFGKQGNTPGTFMRPKGIAVDSDNHVYVVDSEFNNVQVFDQEGRLLMYFGDRGEAAGNFILAAGIAIDKKNRILTTEQWLGRLQVFRYVTDAEAAPELEKAHQQQQAEATKSEAPKPAGMSASQ